MGGTDYVRFWTARVLWRIEIGRGAEGGSCCLMD